MDENEVKNITNVNFLGVSIKKKVKLSIMFDLHADVSGHILVNCMRKSKEHCNTPDHTNNR